jgi:hypothetical protein
MPYDVWTIDIIHDSCMNGSKFWILSIVAEFTRECLAHVVSTHIISITVRTGLCRLFISTLLTKWQCRWVYWKIYGDAATWGEMFSSLHSTRKVVAKRVHSIVSLNTATGPLGCRSVFSICWMPNWRQAYTETITTTYDHTRHWATKHESNMQQ